MSSFKDDITYLSILCASLGGSFACRYLEAGQKRKLFVGLFGLFLGIIVDGFHVLYSIMLVMINILMYKFHPNRKQLGLHSFVLSFSYLVIFRCSSWFGLPEPYKTANAIQLIMTLKVIGLAYEISDATSQLKSTEKKNVLHVSFLDCFAYLYCLCGMFTGPYYSYKVWNDSMNNSHACCLPFIPEILPRLCQIPGYMCLYFLLKEFLPLENLKTDDFYSSSSFFTCFLYTTAVFYHLKMRVYIAWMMSESCCILAGIGAYPIHLKPKVGQGPTLCGEISPSDAPLKITNHDYWNFETIRNIDIYECEFGFGFRSGMRAWNRTVQYWLAQHVYTRVPRQFGVAVTMAVSAYWHGVHAGYYMSFMTIPLCTMAEDLVFPKDNPNRKMNKIYKVIWWFIRTKGFEYMACGFLLLSFNDTIRFWSSIYFYIHILLVMIIALFMFINQKQKVMKME